MAITTKPPASPGIPNSKTTVSESTPAIPVAKTTVSESSPAIPVSKTTVSENAPAIPVSKTTVSEASAGIPVSKTTVSAASPAIPVSKTTIPAAGVPRALIPLVDMHFDSQTFSQNSNAVLFDDLFTYSRNSSATFINRRIVNNKAEFFLDTDFVGTVTNLLIFSEQFDNAAWTKVDLSVVANLTNSPIGDLTADKLIEAANTNTKFISIPDISTTSGNFYTFSIFAKKDGKKRNLRIGTRASATLFPINQDAIFDIVTGTIVSFDSGVIAKIELSDDNWYKLSVSIEATATGTDDDFIVTLVDGVDTGYLGDGSSGALIWGAQVTESVKPLPYVKSIASSAMQTFTESLRIEYDSVTGENLGALIEGASTNLQIRSEEFDFVTWNKGSSTVSANVIASPDGTTSADKFEASSTATITPIISDNPTVAISTTHTVSVFAKASEASVLQIFFAGGHVANDPRVNFNLLTGVVGSQDADIDDATIELIREGFYRVTATVVTATTTLQSFFAMMVTDSDSRNLSNSWTIGDGFYLWGAQLEELPFATSYIRTEGSTVARAADDQDLPVAGNYPNGGDFTVQVEINTDDLPTGGTGANRYLIRADEATELSFIRISTTGAIQAKHGDATIIIAADGAFSGKSKVAMSFNSSTNIITGFLDGVATVSTDAGAVFTPNLSGNIDLGNTTATQHLFGHISKVPIFDIALTAQEVALL